MYIDDIVVNGQVRTPRSIFSKIDESVISSAMHNRGRTLTEILRHRLTPNSALDHCNISIVVCFPNRKESTLSKIIMRNVSPRSKSIPTVSHPTKETVNHSLFFRVWVIYLTSTQNLGSIQTMLRHTVTQAEHRLNGEGRPKNQKLEVFDNLLKTFKYRCNDIYITLLDDGICMQKFYIIDHDDI
ncbi:hypothetical protein RF11_09207 [Thelohanellus kitauei]|uniref:Uncharacterized protein n=1 Tax=Thelohanellus kitauei TaxID=669202 RepID=A0A0C2MV30_THEKT|nr:hypothetical protein RF11_09207 [Thelohanellus kitauei]